MYEGRKQCIYADVPMGRSLTLAPLSSTFVTNLGHGMKMLYSFWYSVDRDARMNVQEKIRKSMYLR
jgi:hypothetical protein